MLQVWVDPHHGDDAAAVALLPRPAIGSGGCATTDIHPHNVLHATTGAPLLHASAPFRTVTAAIGYIQTIHPTGLPATQPDTDIVTEQVVIHCLPGLYGPAGTDPHTGLVFNDETLPIVLPERVSIQGTNSLNTVFVSDGETGVFVFGTNANAFGDEVLDDRPTQYLANIAITGVIRERGYGGSPSVPEEGAAIFVDHLRRVSLLVTNCVLYGNATGVLVDNLAGENEHALYLINNTFAWNVCGIWSGAIDRNATSSEPNTSVGTSQLALVNNVFDTMPPLVAYVTSPRAVEILLFPPVSGGVLPNSWERWITVMDAGGGRFLQGVCLTSFEGVDASDLLVASTPTVDYNAYENNRWNRCSAVLGALTLDSIFQLGYLGLHQTSERLTRGAGPSRGIGGITGEGSQQRGILFVRDLLHEGGRVGGPFNVGSDPNFDRCVGDFRLAPAVLAAGQDEGTPPDTLNPLVDAGLTFEDDGDGVPIPVAMANGLFATPYPFAGIPEDDSIPPSPSEWDLEGFGNPRAYDHPVYVSTPAPIQGVIQTTDLGADELDLQVLVGYRETTTTFIASAVTLPGNRISENDLGFFLCPVEGLTGSAMTGGIVPETSVNVPIHSAYPAFGTWTPLAPTLYYQPTGWLDTVPHLLPDVHPWWFLALTTPSNIEWRSCSPFSGVFNPTLYLNPLVGIANPTGSGFMNPSGGTASWLDEPAWIAFAPGGVWVVRNFLGGAVTTALTNDNLGAQAAWCVMHAPSTPPTVPVFAMSQDPLITLDPNDPNALRVSSEFIQTNAPFYEQGLLRGSNLQSFLIWSEN